MLKNFKVPHVLFLAILSTNNAYGSDNGGGRGEKDPGKPELIPAPTGLVVPSAMDTTQPTTSSDSKKEVSTKNAEKSTKE